MFKKYLLTGATGFLGQAVLTELRGKGEIDALVMPGDRLAESLPADVRAVTGNVCDAASLDSFFAGAGADTCVIHCAGIVSVASDPGQRHSVVTVGGTRNVLDQCIAHGVGKLVHVSSVHAIPEKPKGTVVSDAAVFDPALVEGDYAKSKAMATALVMEAARNGLNASVVLPSGIIGPGDIAGGSITNMLLSFIRGRLPFAVKGGYDFVDVRDVAKGIAACTEKGRPGSCYILSGHYASIRTILETVKKITNVKWLVSYLPIKLAKWVAPFYEKQSLRRKKPLYFTPYSVAVLDSNGAFSNQNARSELGYAPRDLASTLHDTLVWLRGRGLLPRRRAEA